MSQNAKEMETPELSVAGYFNLDKVAETLEGYTLYKEAKSIRGHLRAWLELKLKLIGTQRELSEHITAASKTIAHNEQLQRDLTTARETVERVELRAADREKMWHEAERKLESTHSTIKSQEGEIERLKAVLKEFRYFADRNWPKPTGLIAQIDEVLLKAELRS